MDALPRPPKPQNLTLNLAPMVDVIMVIVIMLGRGIALLLEVHLKIARAANRCARDEAIRCFGQPEHRVCICQDGCHLLNQLFLFLVPGFMFKAHDIGKRRRQRHRNVVTLDNHAEFDNSMDVLRHDAGRRKTADHDR